MPCQSDPYYDRLAEARAEEQRVRRYNKLRRELDTVTALLCHACDKLDRYDTGAITGELRKWYTKHLAEDAKREAKAKELLDKANTEKRKEQHLKSVKSRLMNQLTDDEKEALGL